MRKTLGVAALMLALCCPILAGEIPNPPLVAGEMPTPPAPQTTSGETLNGEIHTPGISDSLTQIALELLASVLP